MYKIHARVKEVQLEENSAASGFCKLSMPKSITEPDSDTRYNILFDFGANGEKLINPDRPGTIALKEEQLFIFSQRFESLILDLHKSGRSAKFLVDEENASSSSFIIHKIIIAGEQ